jgi:hypothetical protein
MHIYMYVMYIYIYIYIYIPKYTHTCLYVCAYMEATVCTHTHIQTSNAHRRVRAHTHTLDTPARMLSRRGVNCQFDAYTYMYNTQHNTTQDKTLDTPARMLSRRGFNSQFDAYTYIYNNTAQHNTTHLTYQHAC